MLTFLEANGFTLGEPPLQIAERLVHVAEQSSDREAAEEEFTDWIRAHLKPLAGPV